MIGGGFTVSIEDASGGVVTSDNSSVTIALGANAGGAAITGTLTVPAVNGIATFNLSIDKPGTGYTFTAADGSFPTVTSNPFNIVVGAADHLAFLQQPTNAGAGQILSPAVTVQVLDAAGNLVTTDSSTVALAIGAQSWRLHAWEAP